MKNLINILLACLITSIGVIILRHSHLVTGGTAGLSLNLSYFSNKPFAIIFFAVNIPFYVFSFIRMGLRFTLSTLFAVTILSLLTSLDKLLPSFTIPSLFGASISGLIVGLGLSFLFMNGSSLGGSNMLALFLQKKYNINPGKTNFLFDFCVVISSFYSVGIFKGLLSILSITITSFIISYFKGKIKVRTEYTNNIGNNCQISNVS